MSNSQVKRDLDNAADELKKAASQATWEAARNYIRRAASELEDAARHLDSD